MRVHDIYISAIGTYLPETVVDAAQAVRDGQYDQDEFVANELTGVHSETELATVEMAVRAARRAIDDFDVRVADLSMIIYTATSKPGPDGWGPAAYVLRSIGADESTLAIEVRHQCSGMFSALQVAVGHLRAAPEHQSVLIVNAENWNSPDFNRWDYAPGLPLGDAAVAMVLTKEPGFARLCSVDSLMVAELEELHRAGASLRPMDGEDNPGTLREASAHFIATSPVVAKMHSLVDGANERLNARTVANSGVELSKMAWVGTINGSAGLVKGRLLPLLGIPPERSAYDIGRSIGHAGAADQTLAFARLLADGKFSPGDHYLMSGFGPGLTNTTAVIEVIDPPAVLQD